MLYSCPLLSRTVATGHFQRAMALSSSTAVFIVIFPCDDLLVFPDRLVELDPFMLHKRG